MWQAGGGEVGALAGSCLLFCGRHGASPKQPKAESSQFSKDHLIGQSPHSTRTGVPGKEKKKENSQKTKTKQPPPPPSINKSEPKAPGGEFLSPMMGQRPGRTRRGPHPKGPHPQEPGPALKFPRRSHLLHKGCLGQPSKASRRFPRGSVFSDSQARAAGGTQSPEAQGAHALGLMPRRQLIVSSQVCQWLLSPGMSPLPTRPVFSALWKTM